MAWTDRDYNRPDRDDGGSCGVGFGRFGMGRHSVVMWLIIINVVVFVWDGIFAGSQRGSMLALGAHCYFSVDKAIYSGQVWRFVTYQFIHAGFLHVLFNMLVLFFFGPLIERWWGSKRFLAFYLLCGVSGAVVASLLGAIPGLLVMPRWVPLVGASGSIFGILIACAVLYPRQRVMLIFPPIPMTMRTMAIVFLVIAFLSLMAGSANAGGEAAHLGGAALGYLLVRKPRLLDWADRFSPTAIQAGYTKGRFERRRRKQRVSDAEVDRILAKVRDKGLQSLSRREKKALAEATERQRRAS